MTNKYYVGNNKNTSKLVTFKSKKVPTEKSHGRRFSYVIGPFKTKSGAVCMAKYGKNNPHLQTVSQAERAAKTWCK